MPIKRFSNRKDDASEVASELASELSLVDRGGGEYCRSGGGGG